MVILRHRAPPTILLLAGTLAVHAAPVFSACALPESGADRPHRPSLRAATELRLLNRRPYGRHLARAAGSHHCVTLPRPPRVPPSRPRPLIQPKAMCRSLAFLLVVVAHGSRRRVPRAGAFRHLSLSSSTPRHHAVGAAAPPPAGAARRPRRPPPRRHARAPSLPRSPRPCRAAGFPRRCCWSTPHPRLIRSSASRHTAAAAGTLAVRAAPVLVLPPPDLEPIVPTSRRYEPPPGAPALEPPSVPAAISAALLVRHCVTSRGLRVDHHRDRADPAEADVPQLPFSSSLPRWEPPSPSLRAGAFRHLSLSSIVAETVIVPTE
ncbi:hypothetical protein Scep_009973 [Stephania cephalantha]|uniref:Uncharacterized protein n=1 Tax=Stephania cephalantha TaxID=152367 RepID=A0AAP0JU80_9MAGN